MDGGKATKRLGDASRQAANPPKKKPRVGDAAEGEQHQDAFTQVLAAAGATIKGEAVLIGANICALEVGGVPDGCRWFGGGGG
jgi:hypothetical protein